MDNLTLSRIVTFFGRRFRTNLRKLSDKSSTFAVIADRVWNTAEIIVFYIVALRSLLISRTAAPIYPLTTMHVSPDNIVHVSPGEFHFLLHTGKIKSGAWDKQPKITFRERYIFESMREHFIEGVSWEHTEFYQLNAQKIRSGEKTKWESIEALDKKCMELDQTYRDIEENGYKTQKELVVNKQTGGIGDGGSGILASDLGALRHEICVDIARDGEILLNEGRHRLAIATLLDIEEFPVRVVARHQQWQNVRTQVSKYIEEMHTEDLSDIQAETQQDVLDEFKIDIQMGIEHPDIQNIFQE